MLGVGLSSRAPLLSAHLFSLARSEGNHTIYGLPEWGEFIRFKSIWESPRCSLGRRRASSNATPQVSEGCFSQLSVHPGEEKVEASCIKKLPSSRVNHLLCLSNGHGEDTIAVSVLKEFTVVAGEREEEIDIQALPLVGLGSAYSQEGFQMVGPAKVMPSGG